MVQIWFRRKDTLCETANCNGNRDGLSRRLGHLLSTVPDFRVLDFDQQTVRHCACCITLSNDAAEYETELCNATLQYPRSLYVLYFSLPCTMSALHNRHTELTFGYSTPRISSRIIDDIGPSPPPSVIVHFCPPPQTKKKLPSER